ncbi:MAG TPA: hydrogenase formation protein HypD, partial [Candidatus Eisenbacteria bacterium]
VTRPWTIMEICGGQTHTFIRFGIDRMLPGRVTLVHGPGCPECVTPLEMIDRALAIAERRGVVFTSFGDMLRVPGSRSDLLGARARGCDVRIVYSPLDAVRLARREPGRQIVFFAVGFETTAPATAMAVWQAAQLGLHNFTILCAHVRVPPALEALLGAPDCRVQGILAAGHVCTVMGYEEYEPIAARHRVPIVVTGFEPLDLVEGVHMVVAALEAGRIGVENQYVRSVRREGNQAAQRWMHEVFEPLDRSWRGLGMLPASGLGLRPAFARFDAERRFEVDGIEAREPSACIAGEILTGRRKPRECPAFGSACTPDHPLGAPMVSSEGACAAYFQYAETR